MANIGHFTSRLFFVNGKIMKNSEYSRDADGKDDGGIKIIMQSFDIYEFFYILFLYWFILVVNNDDIISTTELQQQVEQ